MTFRLQCVATLLQLSPTKKAVPEPFSVTSTSVASLVTPRLGFIELNVVAEIFASERDLLRATYKDMTLLDVDILQGSAQPAT